MRWLLPLLLFIGSAQAAERMMQRFALEFRDARELLPAITPHINDGDTISVFEESLIIRSDLQTLSEIQELIEALDQPPVQLIVSVRQTPRLSRNDDVHRYHTTANDQREINQRLRAEPGRWVTISQGEEIPVPTAGGGGESEAGGNSGLGGQGIEYKPTASGFEVRARLLGDGRVQVEARPFILRPHREGGGRIETHQTITHISGPLGEWLELGGPFAPRDEVDDGSRRYSNRLESPNGYRTLIRIERID